MRSVNIREARQKLSDLVAAAEHGQSVIITRHGKQVARLDPAGPESGAPLPDMTEFRNAIRVTGTPLSKAVAEARAEARY